MDPLASEPAADEIPVAVTCRVLTIARQPWCRWLEPLVTDAELAEAYWANALFEAHRDDPEFGYRYLADEARDTGHGASQRWAWRVWSSNGRWSAFGNKRGKKSPPPVHDDLVQRNFSADAANELWPADNTEHRTRGGHALPVRGQGRVLQPDRGLLHQ